MRTKVAVILAVASALLAFVATQSRPVEAGSDAKSRGAELFAVKGCAHCHGPSGLGGSIGPDLQLARQRRTTAEMTRQIHDGGQAMPAFGEQLTKAEIEDLVAFLRAKRKLVPIAPSSGEAHPVRPTEKDPD